MCAAAALIGCGAAWAGPFTPSGDGEVIERLPLRTTPRERALRQQLRQRPDQLPLALEAARGALERARAGGDPRELGQAQAALSPWWTMTEPPAAVRLLRATIRQSQHDFEGALADLDALSTAGAETPLSVLAQAELTRASILQVQGRFTQAAEGCARLAGRRYAELGTRVEVPARACLAELASLQARGHTAAQKRADDELAALASRAGPATIGWLNLVRAEAAERRGDATQAGRLYQMAIAHTGAGVYPLAAYADFLLSQQRPRDALSLLTGRDDADALLLRRAIALKQLNDPAAAQAASSLKARFDAAGARGESIHAREESRWALELEGDAALALHLAQANWQRQKEPADALVLLRAARATGQPGAADPLRQFMRDTGYTDARLGIASPGFTSSLESTKGRSRVDSTPSGGLARSGRSGGELDSTKGRSRVDSTPSGGPTRSGRSGGALTAEVAR